MLKVGEVMGEPPPELAALIEKVRQWHAGDWEGVSCNQCGDRLPIAHERAGFSLCYKCDGIRAVLEQRYARGGSNG